NGCERRLARGPGLERRPELQAHVVEEPDDHVFLRVEVPEERPGRDLDLFDDVLDRGPVEAALREQPERCVRELGPGALLLPFPESYRGVHDGHSVALGGGCNLAGVAKRQGMRVRYGTPRESVPPDRPEGHTGCPHRRKENALTRRDAYVLVQTDGHTDPIARSLQALPGVVLAEDVRGPFDAVVLARPDGV